MFTHFRILLSFIAAVGAGLGIAVSVGVASANSMIVPVDLVEEIKAAGCAQIDDFYERRPRVLRPPYVYGLSGGQADFSAAVWCARDGGVGSRGSLILIVMPEPVMPFSKCPREIPGPSPGGLSIAPAEGALSEFWTVSKPSGRGEASVALSGSLIRSEYDGVGADYYCHEGQWFFRSFD